MQSTLMDSDGMRRTYQSKIVYWSLNRILIHQLRNNGIFRSFVRSFVRSLLSSFVAYTPKNKTHQLFLLLMFGTITPKTSSSSSFFLAPFSCGTRCHRLNQTNMRTLCFRSHAKLFVLCYCCQRHHTSVRALYLILSH